MTVRQETETEQVASLMAGQAGSDLRGMRPSAAAPRPPWFDLPPAEPLARDLAEGKTPGQFVSERAPIREATALLARDAVQAVAGRLGVPRFVAIVLLANVLGVAKGELREWTGDGIQTPRLRSQLCDAVEAIERRGRWLQRKFRRAFIGRT